MVKYYNKKNKKIFFIKFINKIKYKNKNIYKGRYNTYKIHKIDFKSTPNKTFEIFRQGKAS